MENTTQAFSGGLIKDLHPLNTGKDTYTDALNATFITYNGNETALQNDMGNTRIVDSRTGKIMGLHPGFVPVGMKEHGGVLYIASVNLNGECELGSIPSPIITYNNAEYVANYNSEDDWHIRDVLDNNFNKNSFDTYVKHETRIKPIPIVLQSMTGTGEEKVFNVGDQFILFLSVQDSSPYLTAAQQGYGSITPLSATDLKNSLTGEKDLNSGIAITYPATDAEKEAAYGAADDMGLGKFIVYTVDWNKRPYTVDCNLVSVGASSVKTVQFEDTNFYWLEKNGNRFIQKDLPTWYIPLSPAYQNACTDVNEYIKRNIAIAYPNMQSGKLGVLFKGKEVSNIRLNPVIYNGVAFNMPYSTVIPGIELADIDERYEDRTCTVAIQELLYHSDCGCKIDRVYIAIDPHPNITAVRIDNDAEVGGPDGWAENVGIQVMLTEKNITTYAVNKEGTEFIVANNNGLLKSRKTSFTYDNALCRIELSDPDTDLVIRIYGLDSKLGIRYNELLLHYNPAYSYIQQNIKVSMYLTNETLPQYYDVNKNDSENIIPELNSLSKEQAEKYFYKVYDLGVYHFIDNKDSDSGWWRSNCSWLTFSSSGQQNWACDPHAYAVNNGKAPTKGFLNNTQWKVEESNILPHVKSNASGDYDGSFIKCSFDNNNSTYQLNWHNYGYWNAWHPIVESTSTHNGKTGSINYAGNVFNFEDRRNWQSGTTRRYAGECSFWGSWFDWMACGNSYDDAGNGIPLSGGGRRAWHFGGLVNAGGCELHNPTKLMDLGTTCWQQGKAKKLNWTGDGYLTGLRNHDDRILLKYLTTFYNKMPEGYKNSVYCQHSSDPTANKTLLLGDVRFWEHPQPLKYLYPEGNLLVKLSHPKEALIKTLHAHGDISITYGGMLYELNTNKWNESALSSANSEARKGATGFSNSDRESSKSFSEFGFPEDVQIQVTPQDACKGARYKVTFLSNSGSFKANNNPNLLMRGNAYAVYNDLGSGGKPERLNRSDFRITPYVVWRSSDDLHTASLMGLNSDGEFKLTRYINHNLCPYPENVFKAKNLKQGVSFKNFYKLLQGKTIAQGVPVSIDDAGQTYIKQFVSIGNTTIPSNEITTPSAKYTVLALNITAESSTGNVAYRFVTDLQLIDSTGLITLSIKDFHMEGLIESGAVQSTCYGIVNLDWAIKMGKTKYSGLGRQGTYVNPSEKTFAIVNSDGITNINAVNSTLYIGVQDTSADKDYTINLYNFGVYALGSDLALARIDNSVNMVGAFNASTGEISTGGTMKSVSQSVDDAYSVSVSGTFAGKDLKVNDIIVFVNDVAAGTDVTSNDFTIMESGGLTGSLLALFASTVQDIGCITLTPSMDSWTIFPTMAVVYEGPSGYDSHGCLDVTKYSGIYYPELKAYQNILKAETEGSFFDFRDCYFTFEGAGTASNEKAQIIGRTPTDVNNLTVRKYG